MIVGYHIRTHYLFTKEHKLWVKDRAQIASNPNYQFEFDIFFMKVLKSSLHKTREQRTGNLGGGVNKVA